MNDSKCTKLEKWAKICHHEQNFLFLESFDFIISAAWTKQNLIFFLNLNIIFDVRVIAQKKKFYIKGFFSKCNQIRGELQIWSHLLKKFLMKNFIFRLVSRMQKQKVTWSSQQFQFCNKTLCEIWAVNVRYLVDTKVSELLFLLLSHSWPTKIFGTYILPFQKRKW